MQKNNITSYCIYFCKQKSPPVRWKKLSRKAFQVWTLSSPHGPLKASIFDLFAFFTLYLPPNTKSIKPMSSYNLHKINLLLLQGVQVWKAWATWPTGPWSTSTTSWQPSASSSAGPKSSIARRAVCD